MRIREILVKIGLLRAVDSEPGRQGLSARSSRARDQKLRVQAAPDEREFLDFLRLNGLWPARVVDRYPHVISKIALSWRDPNRLQAVLDELTKDGCGRREGFPADVAAEIAAIRRVCGPRISRDAHNNAASD